MRSNPGPQNGISGLRTSRAKLRRDDGCHLSALLRLQYLEHAMGGGDAALADRDFGVDEYEAPGGAHHAGARDQEVADLAGLDKMHVELDGRHGLLARPVPRGHAAGP